MNTTSHSLLNRLTSGNDHDAWGTFVELYTPLLLAWCRRLGLSNADAADLTQTVFVALYKSLPEFRYDPSRSFRPWLKTVLLNSWRNFARQQRARAVRGALDPDLIADTDPRLNLDDEEYRTQLVRRALAIMQSDFEPTTWKACLEFVVNDRPAKDVAAELGISINAVYVAKSRVLRHLRQELQWLLD